MADNEKQPETEAPSKKGLPPIILVAVGALLGGAGVVFAVPPKQVEVEVEVPELHDVPCKVEDEMTFVFNPKTNAGKSIASITFCFEFETREDHVDEAYDLVKAHWDRAISRCLMMLKARSLRELNSEKGQRIIEQDLLDELNYGLFGSEPEGFATVTLILWKKYMFQ